MFKNLFLVLFLICFVCACTQVQPTFDAVTTAGEIVIMSDQVDDVQPVFAKYVDADRLKRLDVLQTDISKALSGDINSTRLKEIRTEAVTLHTEFNDEIYAKWDTVPKREKLIFTKINEHLEMLDRKIDTFIADPERAKTLTFGKHVLDFVYYSKKAIELAGD